MAATVSDGRGSAGQGNQSTMRGQTGRVVRNQRVRQTSQTDRQTIQTDRQASQNIQTDRQTGQSVRQTGQSD